jgi:hypothetical protein
VLSAESGEHVLYTGRVEPIVVNGEGGTMLAGAEGGGGTLY